MNEILQIIFAIIASAFEMFTTILFYNSCLGKNNVRVAHVVFFVVFVAAYTIDISLSQFGILGAFYIIKSAIILLGLTMLYNAKMGSRIFVVASYLVFCMVAELIGYGVVFITVHNLPENELEYYSLLLSKLISFVIAIIVMQFKKNTTQFAKSKEYIRFLATPLISIATLILISFEADSGLPNAATTICLASVGLMAINVIVYYLLENVMEAAEIRERHSRMEQQFIFQEKKYEQTSQSFKSISSVIHDTNKHLVYLSECIERKEFNEAKRYIHLTMEQIDKSYKRINTGFLPIDALVSNAFHIAANNNINLKSDIKIEKERINIERYDICVALGNLLDNALEASRKVNNPDDRKISVSIITDSGSMMINVVNSAERIGVSDLKSNKKDKLLHGYGLSNIKAIADKYGGVFTIERKESQCEATLFLPIE